MSIDRAQELVTAEWNSGKLSWTIDADVDERVKAEINEIKKSYPGVSPKHGESDSALHRLAESAAEGALSLSVLMRLPIDDVKFDKAASIKWLNREAVVHQLQHPQRGPKAGKSKRVRQEMQQDLDSGKLSPDQLAHMTEKQLAVRYGGVARDTVRKARNAILSKRVETLSKLSKPSKPPAKPTKK